MADNKYIWQQMGTRWRGVGIYHVTFTAVERNAQKGAFGELKWEIENEEVKGAKVVWTPLGRGVSACIESIPEHYPMIKICAAVIMPDHVHMILYVTERMEATFNMVLRGWKQGCKKVAREVGFEGELFAGDPFIRVMTYKGQLQTMIEYVKQNPFRMAVRLAYSENFAIQREVEVAGRKYAAVGNLHLLYQPKMWQVHVHKELVWDAEKGNDKPLRDYKNQCILQARQGATLISPFISKDEAAVRDVALKEKHAIIYILDNGMPPKRMYKPSGMWTEGVAQGRVLILAPWEYEANKKGCTREECNAMNKMAEDIVKAALV